MTNKSENLEMVLSKNQLRLYGYEDYFDSFVNLYRKNKFPNTILLSGPKGSGKLLLRTILLIIYFHTMNLTSIQLIICLSTRKIIVIKVFVTT